MLHYNQAMHDASNDPRKYTHSYIIMITWICCLAFEENKLRISLVAVQSKLLLWPFQTQNAVSTQGGYCRRNQGLGIWEGSSPKFKLHWKQRYNHLSSCQLAGKFTRVKLSLTFMRRKVKKPFSSSSTEQAWYRTHAAALLPWARQMSADSWIGSHKAHDLTPQYLNGYAAWPLK